MTSRCYKASVPSRWSWSVNRLDDWPPIGLSRLEDIPRDREVMGTFKKLVSAGSLPPR